MHFRRLRVQHQLESGVVLPIYFRMLTHIGSAEFVADTELSRLFLPQETSLC